MRLSVSDLESFRYWNASEDSTLDELIARLMHTEPPTPQMEAGRAFAKLMEHAGERSLHVEEVDGWEFYFDMESELSMPTVRELKGEMVFETADGPVTLVGQVDGFDGRVYDAKLTGRVDPERYLDSLQWRAYLLMFGAREFVYDIFHAKYESGGKRVTVDEHHRMSFFAYPEMRAEVERAVRNLAHVVAHVVALHVPMLAEGKRAANG
jgi:hypothetical protein